MTSQRETRGRLVEHAVGLVEEVGLARFTAREVARRVGVSHAAPFRHFPSRTALLADAAAEGFLDLQARLVTAVDRPAVTERELVIRLGMEYVAFAQARPALFELMFRSDVLNDAGGLVQEHCRSVFALMTGRATGPDVRIATPLDTTLLAVLHGLAVLASQGLLGPVTREHVRLALERHWLARPSEDDA
jgi:AcrR family transcriptional regulator